MNEKERVICEFKTDFKNSFCWRSNISSDHTISWRPGLKNGQDLVNRAAYHRQEFPGVPSPALRGLPFFVQTRLVGECRMNSPKRLKVAHILLRERTLSQAEKDNNAKQSNGSNISWFLRHIRWDADPVHSVGVRLCVRVCCYSRLISPSKLLHTLLKTCFENKNHDEWWGSSVLWAPVLSPPPPIPGWQAYKILITDYGIYSNKRSASNLTPPQISAQPRISTHPSPPHSNSNKRPPYN